MRCTLNPVTILHKRKWEIWTEARRERRRKCEDGGRDRSDVVTSQGMPRAIRIWKKQEGSSIEPSEGIDPVNTLVLDFRHL